MDKMSKVILNYSESKSRFVAKVLMFIVPICILILLISLIVVSGIKIQQLFEFDDKKKTFFLIMIIDIIAIFRAYPAPHKLIINSKGEMFFFSLFTIKKRSVRELLEVEVRKFLFVPTYIVFTFKHHNIKIYYSLDLENIIMETSRQFSEFSRYLRIGSKKL